MNTQERRDQLLKDIKKTETPLSASKLAKKYTVSRQIIVGDVAILKAQKEPIISTARGYLYAKTNNGELYTVACKHSDSEMDAELFIIVDQGATILDVIVEHPLYGGLVGTLNITSRYDVEQFSKKCKKTKARLLSEMDYGIHLHTIVCSSNAQFERIQEELDKAGFLYR